MFWIVITILSRTIHLGIISDILGYFPPLFLIVPLLLYIAWALFQVTKKRSVRLNFAALVVATVAAAWLCGFAFGGDSGSVQERDLRVMTLNVHYESREVPKTLEMIRAGDPDVIFLQENKGGASSPASYLHSNLPGFSMVQDGEVAILSRWPITKVRSLPSRSMETRVILSAEIAAPRPFTAITTHWSVPQWFRGPSGFQATLKKQSLDAEDTNIALQQTSGAVVLAGDFNNPPSHRHTQALSKRLQNAFSVAGSGTGWTFPDCVPFVRIDHIYTTPELAPMRCWVGGTAGSDHHSLWADFKMTND